MMRDKVITPKNSVEGNPNSEPSVLGLDHTFTYDIYNAPDPDSLLLEILSRLPLKPIFRFKCVCKHWLTLISPPSFSRFYLTAKAGSSSLAFRIVYKYIYESEFEGLLDRFSPESYSSSDSVLFMFREQKSIMFKVLGTSNGLISCCSLGPMNYYVCDPVTRLWVTIPSRTGKCKKKILKFYGEGFVSRVNADNVVTSYTVVRVEKLESRLNYLSLETFSSETGKWVYHNLPCPNSIGLMKRGAGPITFNGILHWFVYDHGMVAFDPYKVPKSCRLIQFPDDRDVESEDYEKGEWCSEFKVTRSDLSSSDPDLNRRRLDVACKPLGVVDDLSWRVVMPFVIPRWPTPVPIPPAPKKVWRPEITVVSLC
ncbi:hypothetical protein L1987_59046 [Smallanthus sonchifolius]|uniref:Uncharacterized protein n=1 Tax=Smallanthus sonchifolius TaxID=185202 RepID=A0ACB9D474_9ASTR|nr:hypothetical protein L1987_59046 [Smallanthus sonchifolius]